MLRRVRWQLVTEVSGQHLGPNSHTEGSRSPLGDGTDTLPQNVGDQMPTYAAQHPRTAKTSNTPRRKPEISHSSLDVLEELLFFRNTKGDIRVQRSPPLELVLGFLSWYEINGKRYLNKHGNLPNTCLLFSHDRCRSMAHEL
jgi:hypothetical protein